MRKAIHKKDILIMLPSILISALIISAQAQTVSLKKIIAVSRFENKTSFSGQWNLDDGMADQLTEALIKTNQFMVLERQTLNDIFNEQDLAASGRALKSKSAMTGKLTSAQILIKGTITEFDIKSSGSGAGIGIKGFKIGGKKEEAHVGLIISLIDTTTGEVIDSQRVEGKAQSGGFKLDVDVGGIDFGTESFKKTPLGKATQMAIDNASEYIASRLKNIPFRGSVIKVDGEILYINAGKQTGISEGDMFAVYSVGEELTDPDTGVLLGVEEEEIGKIKVIQASEKYSKAKIISGKGFKRGDIIRAQ